MDAVLLHVLNHCGRAADRIKRTNEALKGGLPPEDAPRDQGFTRAKVPTANCRLLQSRPGDSRAESRVCMLRARVGSRPLPFCPVVVLPVADRLV